MNILVTGSSGLIGSEAVEFFLGLGHDVVAVDNESRHDWFRTRKNVYHAELRTKFPGKYAPYWADVSSCAQVAKLYQIYGPFDVVIHCAAQPSHDFSAMIPVRDFEVNALGTLNLLEQTRLNSRKATFIFMSTNKVYGDRPNRMSFEEKPTRYEHPHPGLWNGFSENLSVDQSLHSVFGASKVAADVMTQEYGRYFGLNTVVFRAGCLTGRRHQGAELHGFLSYLAKCVVIEKEYVVYGYKGKQVRDNLHSLDVANAMECVIAKPPKPGSVFNIGGGRENSCSVLEAIDWMERVANKKLNWRYEPEPRKGDHKCYITDFWKFQTSYPQWRVTKDLRQIYVELVENERQNLSRETVIQPSQV